jgi:NAD(P)-dependent dehydrogenase (short-subunit alcohol dehydrogenase family)
MQDGGSAAVFGATGGIGAAFVEALGQRGWRVRALSRSGERVRGARAAITCDVTDEASVMAAAATLAADPPDLTIVATGALTLTGGKGPERTYRQIDPHAMAQAFRINTIGPALVAKHVLPLLPRDRRSVFAALGARVGSIGDNRLGGWHSYRASKAALAMLLRNFAIELSRTHPHAVIVGLHPGTVDTPLSAPFQANLRQGQLTSAVEAAGRLLAVIDGLAVEASGTVVDYAGATVPP